MVPLDEAFVEELKFSECLDDETQEKELSARYDVTRDVEALKKFPIRKVQIA